MDEISAQLVINFDQTGLNISELTIELEGLKRVEVAGKEYEGKTPLCLPNHEFSEKWDVTYSANHWSNETTMKEYINNILLPYIKK